MIIKIIKTKTNKKNKTKLKQQQQIVGHNFVQEKK